MTTEPTPTPAALGKFCSACQAIPAAGYCKLPGCPMLEGTPPSPPSVLDPGVLERLVSRLDEMAHDLSDDPAKLAWPYQLIRADSETCRNVVSDLLTASTLLTAYRAREAAGSEAQQQLERLRAAVSKSHEEVCQTLGKALGYPWFKDDQKNFPGATEAEGVCVGEHVAETLAEEAASKLTSLQPAWRPDREAVVKLIREAQWSPASGPVHWTTDKVAHAAVQADALADAILALPAGSRWRPTHRHVKRGTDYALEYHARLQTDKPLTDYALLVTYRGKDGTWWARPDEEFNDGRFEPIPPPPAPIAAEGEV